MTELWHVSTILKSTAALSLEPAVTSDNFLVKFTGLASSSGIDQKRAVLIVKHSLDRIRKDVAGPCFCVGWKNPGVSSGDV